MDDSLICKRGESITGDFRLAPNKQNPRDLDMQIDVQFEGKHCSMTKSFDYAMR